MLPRYLYLATMLACCYARGQTPLVDSLSKALDHAEGTARIDILNRLTFELISVDNPRAMKYCSLAQESGKELRYIKGMGSSYTYRGVYEYLSGEFSDGRANLKRGLQLSVQANDRNNQGYSLLQLGNSFLDQAQLDSSLYFYRQAYDVLKDSINPVNLSKLYKHLSILYGIRSQFDLQEQYLLRCLRIREALGSKQLLADALVLLASFRVHEAAYDEAKLLLGRAERILASNPADRENLHDLYHQRALILFHDGKAEQAFVLFDSARNFYFRSSLLQKLVTLLTDMGKVFSDRGDYELALKHFYSALRVAELKGYEVEVMEIQIELGWVNFHLGEPRQSLEFAELALKPALKNGMPSKIAESLNLKGVVLSDQGDYVQAKSALDQVLAIRQGLNDKPGISEAYLNLGELESFRHNSAASIELFQKSLALADSINFEFGKAWSCWGLGAEYFKAGMKEKAKELLRRSERYARAINASEVLIRVYNARRDLAVSNQQFQEALHYSEAADHLKDSVHRADLARRFANLQMIEEIEKRDRNIKVLNQDKELAEDKIKLQNAKLRQQYFLLIGGSISLALLGVLAFVYARFYTRIKRLNNELTNLYKAVSEQKEEIQSQAEELTTSNHFIGELNKNLENLVVEKTRDIQRANEELVKHNNELLQFSYTVSHNLRGPVARLLGLTSLLKDAGTLEEARLLVGLVRKTSIDLDLILNDLSKIIDIRNDLHDVKEYVDLEKEWLNCCDLLHDTIKAEFIIMTDFSRAPSLFSIKPMVQSIFYNLLSNAIKYRSPDRDLRVNIVTYADKDNTIIEISDNGLGLDVAQYRDSIFKLFKRFHNHVEGRGLGLYLVKSQVEALNGSIEVESTLGQGSTFRIIIPGTISRAAHEMVQEGAT